MPRISNPNHFLEKLFFEAVNAALPENNIGEFLPEKPTGKLVLVGAGKASSQMAKVFEDAWEQKYGTPIEGIIVTRYGGACTCRFVEVIEAAHPVPDEAGLRGAKRIVDAVSNLGEDDLVVALISGGGSALLPAPPAGLTLEDEIAVNEALLASGAPISAMNTVRKALSTIKGGRLALTAYPAKVVSLLVSDIPGDHAHLIASGPTVADNATPEEAISIVKQYAIVLPDAVMKHLNSPLAKAPLPDDPRLVGSEHKILTSASKSLEAAAALAKAEGIEAHILSDAIEGEACEIAKMHASIAKEVLHCDRPFKKPVLLLSGGETTVTLRGKGKGGRNTEFLLSFALEIAGEEGIYALSADTDGIDGSENNAGAFVDGATAAQMQLSGIQPQAYLQNNDAWSAFDKINALFISKPTGTNVNDFRAILIAE